MNETYTISGDDDYRYITANFEDDFILQWSAENQLSRDLDFDVFLVTESEFRVYQDIVDNGDDRQFEYLTEGTAQGIRDSASRTITLSGGQTYVLIIDNTDLGDAGDVGQESTRQVQVSVQTRRA